MERGPGRAPGVRTDGRLPTLQIEHKAAPDTPSHLSGENTAHYPQSRWEHVCKTQLGGRFLCARLSVKASKLILKMETHLWGTCSFGDRSFVVPIKESFSKHKLSVHYYPRLPACFLDTRRGFLCFSQLQFIPVIILNQLQIQLDLRREMSYPQWLQTGCIKGSVVCNGPTTWPWMVVSPWHSGARVGICRYKHTSKCWFTDKNWSLIGLIWFIAASLLENNEGKWHWL